MRSIPLLLVALLAVPAGGAASVPDSETSSRSVERARARTVAPLARLRGHFEGNHGQCGDGVSFLARASSYSATLTSNEVTFRLPSSMLRMRFEGAESSARMRPGPQREGRSHYLLGDDPTAWVTDVPHLDSVRTEGVYAGIDVRWRSGCGRTLAYDLVVRPGTDPEVVMMSFHGADRLSVANDGTLVVATPDGEMRHSAPRLFQILDGRTRPVSGRFVLRGKHRVGFDVGEYDRDDTLVIDPEIKYATYVGGSSIIETAYDVAIDGNEAAYVVGFTRGTDFPTKAPLQGSNAGDRDAFVFKVNASGTALVFSTYLGGSKQDIGKGIAVDGSGAVYVGGDTFSSNFPTKSPIQSSHGGGSNDAWVAKLNAAGSALVYSTYHGGSADDGTLPGCLAIDGSGNAFLVGGTLSTDFPTKSAVYSSKQAPTNTSEQFITKFNSNGSALSYSTYYSGNSPCHATGIAVDGNGAAYVTGLAGSDLPTKSPIQGTAGGSGDGYVLKLNSSGSAVYATYVGGSGIDEPQGIAVDEDGAAYVVGVTASTDFPTKSAYQGTNAGGARDVFVTKVNAGGTAWEYSTYLGGSGDDRSRVSSFSEGAIAVDGSGIAYVTGGTDSTDFPTTSALSGGGSLDGSRDAFVSALKATGDGLVYSTYLGGSDLDYGLALTADASGNVYAIGRAVSTDFPLKGALQSTMSGPHDSYVVKIGAATAPPEPEGLTVTASSDLSVDLAWTDASSGESKFELERKTGAGAFAEIAEPASNSTTYADTAVTGDMTYTYRIRAVNDVGPSDWSNEVTAATIASPDQLAGTVVSNTRVDLAWSDRSGSEDGFELERKAVADAGYASIGTVGADVTALSDTTALPETEYLYRVRATKGAGASGWSNVATVTTPPADPSGVLPTSNSDTEVRITWADQSLAEDGFEIERGVGCPPSVWMPLASVGPGVTQYTDTTATPETTFAYRVRAINADGTSEWAAAGCVTMPPFAPSGHVATPLSPSRVRVAWQDNSSAELGYILRRALASEVFFEEVARLPASATEYLDDSVTQETDYIYDVTAYDLNGNSARVATDEFRTPALLIVRKSAIKRAKKKRPSRLLAVGEFDVGGTGVDFTGAATLGVGDGSVAIAGFTAKGKKLRFQSDEVLLDLKPSASSSRVAFKLKVTGALVDAIDPDGDLTLSFETGEYRAMGTIGLAGDKFVPGKLGEWLDPPFNLVSLRAKLKGQKGALTIKAAFNAAGGVPAQAPDVIVRLGFFTFWAQGDQFEQKGDKWLFSQKQPGSRKVTLDYRKGVLTIALKSVDLGGYEKGPVRVTVGVEFADVLFEDTPEMASTGKSLKY